MGCSQRTGNLAHIPSCSLGSYYPISVELSSPKLCAYKSKPGPRLLRKSYVKATVNKPGDRKFFNFKKGGIGIETEKYANKLETKKAWEQVKD